MLGIRHEVLPLDDVGEVDVAQLVSAYAEPFACTSALGMLRICEAISPSATVLLTGDGGDDVFLGYPRHKHLLWAQRAAAFLPSRGSGLLQSVSGALPRRGIAKRAANFVGYAGGGLGAFLDANDGLPSFAAAGLLGDRLRDVPVSTRGLPRSVAEGRRVLSAYLEHDRSAQFVSEYMVKVDGAAMFHSIEARSPFLDRDLWEFAAALPYDCRLHRGELKAILREIARRNLGGAVANRRKSGFLVPADRWIVRRRRAGIIEQLKASPLVRDGWIRSDGLDRLALPGTTGGGQVARQLWYLLILDAWISAGGQPHVGRADPIRSRPPALAS